MIKRIVVSENNTLSTKMVNNEKSATLGDISRAFNYYLKETSSDKLPQLKAWFLLKKQMADEGFNADKFETLVFNNFIDKDKNVWNGMSKEERESWMNSNGISGIDLNYSFANAQTGYSITDPKNGSSAQYFSPSTSKEPYNFGSYGDLQKAYQSNQNNKQEVLEKSNYFGMGDAGKEYWKKLQTGRIENSPEPKFKK